MEYSAAIPDREICLSWTICSAVPAAYSDNQPKRNDFKKSFLLRSKDGFLFLLLDRSDAITEMPCLFNSSINPFSCPAPNCRMPAFLLLLTMLRRNFPQLLYFFDLL